ncbi:MAG: hypothetical protein V4591_06795 [Bdellovibrionota bacterium]
MAENKIPINWKKIQAALIDSAKMSSHEIKRGIYEAKNQLSKFQLIQKRKDLFAELGRSLYEANHDGLPPEILNFVKSTELHEIINEIKEVDYSIAEINKEKNG